MHISLKSATTFHKLFILRTKILNRLFHPKYYSTHKLYQTVFLGSDNFSLPSLIALCDLLGQENVSVVVSNVNNLIGKYAKKNNLKLFQWEEYKTEEFPKSKENFGVVASFGYLIPEKVINRFPLGILNVHASLLPRWRGAAPIAHAIMFGDTSTGVSIMQIAPKKFDIGPVLYQKEVPIHPHIRRPELTTILAKLGAESLSHTISNLDQLYSNPMRQDESKAKLSPKLVPEMAEIDWSSNTALQLYNKFRGLYGVFKLKTSFAGKRVDLDEMGLVLLSSSNSCDKYNNSKVIDKENFNISTNFQNFYPFGNAITYLEKDLDNDLVPGQMIYQNEILFVKCVNASSSSKDNYLPYITVKRIKVGNKWMTAKDFQNGFLSKYKKPNQKIFNSSQIPENEVVVQVMSSKK